jgi:anti-anti-sigma factor
VLPVTKFDRALFDRVARTRTPWLDRFMPALSKSANYSRLWLVIAAMLALTGGRRAQRAVLRGLGSIALTSPVVNVGIKRLIRRPRPSLRRVPVARRLRTQPATTSFPSGHAASAAAFAVGAASEMPRAAVPLGVLAGTVAYSRVYVGVHYPLDVLTGAAMGAGVALLARHRWPAVPTMALSVYAERIADRLDISMELNGDTARLSLRGELDLASDRRLAEMLKQVADDDVRNVVIDLRGVTLIDSTGMRWLITADALSQEEGFRLWIVRAPGAVENALHASGMSARLPIVDQPPDLGD